MMKKHCTYPTAFSSPHFLLGALASILVWVAIGVVAVGLRHYLAS